MAKTMVLSDFLTNAQIQQSSDLFIRSLQAGTSELQMVNAVCEQIIRPNMAAIDKKLGQKCAEMYLAYAVYYALTQVR